MRQQKSILPSMKLMICGTIVSALLAYVNMSVQAGDKPLKLVFEDNFDGKALNKKHWQIIRGNGCPQLCGFGNNERQAYTKSKDNLYVKDGKLFITAIKKSGKKRAFKSAKITTKPTGGWKYGKISVRAKIAKGIGSWSAIWMMPQRNTYGGWPKSGEIDMMEHVGYDQGRIHGTIHTEAFNHIKKTEKNGQIVLKDAHEKFYTYSIVWTENKITWLADDKEYFSLTKESGDTSDQWPFDQPYHLILNLAVGGNWGGREGIVPAHFPTSMVVDWVKVWQ